MGGSAGLPHLSVTEHRSSGVGVHARSLACERGAAAAFTKFSILSLSPHVLCRQLILTHRSPGVLILLTVPNTVCEEPCFFKDITVRLLSGNYLGRCQSWKSEDRVTVGWGVGWVGLVKLIHLLVFDLFTAGRRQSLDAGHGGQSLQNYNEGYF